MADGQESKKRGTGEPRVLITSLLTDRTYQGRRHGGGGAAELVRTAVLLLFLCGRRRLWNEGPPKRRQRQPKPKLPRSSPMIASSSARTPRGTNHADRLEPYAVEVALVTTESLPEL
jgi:hypothetical protein